uniref:Putative ovule protein n=1 Tax=Solanum chacoense TaxID=4108 RepID=A0A0V0GKP4_SOLCH
MEGHHLMQVGCSSLAWEGHPVEVVCSSRICHPTWEVCLPITTECQTTHLVSNTMAMDRTMEARLTKQVQGQTRAMLLIHLMGTPIRIQTCLEEICPILITDEQL